MKLPSFESLIKTSYNNLSLHFKEYLSIYFVNILLVFLSIIFCLIIGITLYSTKLFTLSPILLGLFILMCILILFYIVSITSLSTISVIIDPNKFKIIQRIKLAASLAPKYMVINILIFIFLIGLLPISLLTIFIIHLVWSIWGMFNLIVYYKYQYSGLRNLFVSKKYINQAFFSIAFMVVLLSLFSFIINGILSSIDNIAASLASIFFNILYSGFALFFQYEIFKNLKTIKEENDKNNKIWIYVSVAGLLLLCYVIYKISMLPEVYSPISRIYYSIMQLLQSY